MAQAYRAAVVAGLSPVEFWQMTPYLTRIAMSALYDGRATQAWQVANLTRARKLPRLRELMQKKNTTVRPGMEAELKAYFKGKKEKR